MKRYQEPSDICGLFDEAFAALAKGKDRRASELTAAAAPDVAQLSGDGASLRRALICAAAREDYIDHVLLGQIEKTRGQLTPEGAGLGVRLPLRSVNAIARAVLIRVEFGRDPRTLLPLLDLLSALLPLSDEANGIRDAERGSVGPGWSSRRKDGTRVNECSNDGLIAVGVALAAVLARKPDAPVSTDARAAIESLLPLARSLCRFYLDEVETDAAGHFYMRSRIDRRIEPYNHVHPWAAACGLVGYLLDEQELRDVGTGFLRTFQALTLPDPKTGLPFWSYRPPLEEEPIDRGEQIWKAFTTLMLPLSLQKIDSSLDVYIKSTYVPMFLHAIYSGPDRKTGCPTFQIPIGNSKPRPLERHRIQTAERRGRVQHLAEWALLGRYEPKIDDILFDAVIRRPDLFPRGWNGSPRHLAGLADILARRPELPAHYLKCSKEAAA